jgi:hypothetical protein
MTLTKRLRWTYGSYSWSQQEDYAAEQLAGWQAYWGTMPENGDGTMAEPRVALITVNVRAVVKDAKNVSATGRWTLCAARSSRRRYSNARQFN